MTPSDVPFFVDPVAPQNSGVDFLGLAAVGERLIGSALPGINNVTRYVRAYSMASWTAWKFDQFLEEHHGRRLSAEPKVLFRKFREKVELTFSWANKEFDAAIGKRRKYPSGTSAVEMLFKNPVFGNESQASWFAAAAYGPSFASTSGLGFIQSISTPTNARGVARPTSIGTEMAKGFDARLQQAGAAYQRIADVLEQRVSPQDLKTLLPCVALDKLSSKEKVVFRDVLFQANRVGHYDSSAGNRSSTIALILRSLQMAGELNVQGVRECLTRGMSTTGQAVDMTDIQPTQRLWFAVSVRQLQRVALERLLTWFETAVSDRSVDSVQLADLLELASNDLRKANPEADQSTVGYQLEALSEAIQTRGGPETASLDAAWLNVFDLQAQLVAAMQNRLTSVPAISLAALLLCGAIVRVTTDDPSVRDFYLLGGSQRCGLQWFSKFLDGRRDKTLTDTLKDVISSLVYGQQLRTAAARFEEGKNKFRFATDESGIQLLIGRDSISRQLDTPDRIAAVLHLMADSGLIYRREGLFGVD